MAHAAPTLSERLAVKMPAVVLAAFLLAIAGAASANEALWNRLKQGGYVLLIRHAATEQGVGDPPGFRLDDCATQRNLSAEGRAQARRLGEALRGRGIAVTQARSSQWCRCMETARLAFGRAEPWPALNSLFGRADQESEQNRAVLALTSKLRPPANLALVTHNANVQALVGVSPATSEIVIARPENGRLALVGRIPAP
jgi:phosphohistidine phosphatase SixA